MAYTEVEDDQFEWSGMTVTHLPTGARFTWAYANSKSTEILGNWKSADDELPNGEDYDCTEIFHAARVLLEAKYPRH